MKKVLHGLIFKVVTTPEGSNVYRNGIVPCYDKNSGKCFQRMA